METDHHREVAFEHTQLEYHDYFWEHIEKNKRCRGLDGRVCDFALSSAGGRAHVHRQASSTCLLCSPPALAEACAAEGGPKKIAGMLRRLTAPRRAVVLEQRLSVEDRARVQAALAKRPAGLPAVRRKPAAAVDVGELDTRWQRTLDRRRALQPGRSAATKKHYRERVLADRATARRKMHRPAMRALPGAPVSNDNGLPAASLTERAKAFERWCLYHSWVQCDHCGHMLPRDLTEATLMKDQRANVPAGRCSVCQSKRNVPVPTSVEDCPAVLRAVKPELAALLSPLVVDVGPEVRAKYNTGYRQHATMVRFHWKSETVQEALDTVPDGDDRRALLAAYHHLLSDAGSSYKLFHTEHAAFLERHPEPSEQLRRRRLQFLERPGLECALWPCLFWKTSMTFTHERATGLTRADRGNVEPLERVLFPDRARAARAMAPVEAEEDEAAEDDEHALEDDGARHSLKKLFAALALGPCLGRSF